MHSDDSRMTSWTPASSRSTAATSTPRPTRSTPAGLQQRLLQEFAVWEALHRQVRDSANEQERRLHEGRSRAVRLTRHQERQGTGGAGGLDANALRQSGRSTCTRYKVAGPPRIDGCSGLASGPRRTPANPNRYSPCPHGQASRVWGNGRSILSPPPSPPPRLGEGGGERMLRSRAGRRRAIGTRPAAGSVRAA